MESQLHLLTKQQLIDYVEAMQRKIAVYEGTNGTEDHSPSEFFRETSSPQTNLSFWRSLFTLMDEGVSLHELVTDSHGTPIDYRIIDINPSYERITGISRENAVGALASEVYNTAEPPYLELYANVALSLVPQELEVYFAPMDKSFKIHAFAPCRGQFATVFTNITAEKKLKARQKISDDHLNALRMYSEDYVMIADENGKPVWFNTAYADIMKRALGIEMKPGIQPHKLLPDREGVEWWDNLHKRVLGGEKTTVEYSHTLPDTGTQHLQVTFTPFVEEDRVKGFTEITRDITARKNLEAQLVHAEKMRAVGQLAGGIAHDFNNQLVAILGFADMLRDRNLDKDVQQGYVEKIIVASERAASLTSQLLAFSRQGKYQSMSVDIHAIISEVVSILQHSIDKGITIILQLQAENSFTTGDPTQLQNAILNIALNGRDAMPEGGRLTFDTNVVEIYGGDCQHFPEDLAEGKYIVISVSDTGMGMDGPTCSRIFEPFFTTKPLGKGTGMGMAATYGSIRNHNGAISVASEEGVGTTVSVYLPSVHFAEAGEETMNPKQAEKHDILNVMIIDDEDDVREIGALMLETVGHGAVVFADGESAITYYKSHWQEVDVVIFDMVMPGMNGRDTFVAIKKINPEVKAILSSGYSLNEEAQSILDLGVQEFIQKPFRRSELMETVAALFGENT